MDFLQEEIVRLRSTVQEHRSVGLTITGKIAVLYRLDLYVVVLVRILRACGSGAFPVLHVDRERMRRDAPAGRRIARVVSIDGPGDVDFTVSFKRRIEYRVAEYQCFLNG